MSTTKSRSYNFPRDVRLRVYKRQDGVCAACDTGLIAITMASGRTAFVNEDHDDVVGHHVIPDQCGKYRPQYAAFLRTDDNCVLICRECHDNAHEYGKFQNGIVANPSYFPFSHGADTLAHDAWCKKINAQWGVLFS